MPRVVHVLRNKCHFALITRTGIVRITASLLTLVLVSGNPALAANLTWDSGNTNNAAGIEAGGGTWDLGGGNLVWNNAGANQAWVNGNSAIFAGADGVYGIKVGAAVNPSIMSFLSSGYVLTNNASQTITLNSVSTSVPKLAVAAGKTVTIGTNVTVDCPNSSWVGNLGDTPGGTVVIENGGLLEEITGNTWALDGAGTVLSVKTGGTLRHASGGSGQLAIGVGNTGNPATLSVDGGGVLINANNCGFNIASGVAGVAGTLTLNSGAVSMPAGTTLPLNVGTQAGTIGRLNLNGGTLRVAQVRKDPGALATNNFNGGTLLAANANFGSSFLTGLDRANIRNGGAIIDSGTFAITIGQVLEHSDIAGDNAIDGGLTKLGAGTLTLMGANTYTGSTIVGAGKLALGGSLKGPVIISAGGTLTGGSSLGPISISNNLTLNGAIILRVDKTSGASNDIVKGVAALSYGGTLELDVSGGTLAVGDTFKLFYANSYGGAFTHIKTVPALANNFAFDTTGLLTNGSFKVVASTNPLPGLIFSRIPSGLLCSWNTTPLYQYQLIATTNLTKKMTNWDNYGPCLLANGDQLSQTIPTTNPAGQFFSFVAMPLPVDVSRLPAQLWKNTQWKDPGGWTTIDVTTQGLPSNNTNVDAAAQIASIINNTSGRRRLYFPAGIYSFKSPLTINGKSDLWIDGDGRTNTIFRIDAPGSANAEIGFRGSKSGGAIAVIGSPAAGDITVTVADAGTLNVGDLIQLYANNAPLVQGGLAFVTHVYGQMFKVAAKSGNTLTLDMKILLDYPSAYAPLVQRYNQIQNIKVSRISINRVNQPTNQDVSNLEFFYGYNCCAVQMESNFSQRHHIYFENSKDCLIESNYIHDCFVHTTGGYGYGYGLVGSTGCRISNNKSTRLRHQVILQIGANYNVVSYNSSETCYDYNDMALHASYAYMNLFEGNMCQQSYADTSKDGSTDAEPATGPGNTWFRNYVTQQIGSTQSDTSRQNIIGNDVGSISSNGSNHYIGANDVAASQFTFGSSWPGGAVNWGVFPTNIILPASLYLTNRPSFFNGNTTWPVFGPGIVNWGVTNVIPAWASVPTGS